MSQHSGLSTRSRALSESFVNVVHLAGRNLPNSDRYVVGASPRRYRTPISAVAWQTIEVYTNLTKRVPYKRIAKPEDIGRAAARLASDASDYVTSTSLFLGGGMTLFPGFASGG